MAEEEGPLEDEEMKSEKLEIDEDEGEVSIDSKFLNKWGAGIAVFSFGFLCVGSFLLGATATTSFLRGLGGAILFGSLFWLVGTMMTQKENL